MDRRHPEDPSLEAAERDHLGDHRRRLDHEQPAQDDQQQLRIRHDRERPHQPSEGERPGIPHEDPGRRGVPPQESGGGPDSGPRDDREIERGVDVDRVAGGARDHLARVPELPERDEDERGEHEDRRTRGEAVESIGQVDRVRGGREDQEHP
jgi:hypothetical protein